MKDGEDFNCDCVLCEEWGSLHKEVTLQMSANESKCYISTETSLHTRRCFMTGEYCSQKINIQKERNGQIKKWERSVRKAEKQEGAGEKQDIEPLTITAFVIMDFSDMSDVVYKWRIESFIESLHKYLYLDKKEHHLYCYASVEKENPIINGQTLDKVGRVRVIRSDSDPASNYVICSRICQQMQIADLVIVDVSRQNPNVFYEFGMAVALDKLILPICYSESFYKIEYPEMLKKIKEEDRLEKKTWEELEKHIGCYPWQKRLLEYYGIRYKHAQKNDEKHAQKDDEKNNQKQAQKIEYLEFEKIIEKQYGFSDEIYNRFPYDAEIQIDGKPETKIGRFIYEKLRERFNTASADDNTLIVYTMDGFLNGDQAGRCIVNFYRSITRKMQKEQCFRGERVGVLVQENVIPERDKDTEIQRNLPYYIGEIIHIGVNQATFLATKEKVKAEDAFKVAKYIKEPGTDASLTPYVREHRKEIIRFVKQYIRNRGMIIYPNNPVYVERVKHLFTDVFAKLDEGDDYADNSFCLYHIMLKNLRYVNEIVVDITSNCLQSLFWLGAAHGAEIYAVTVKSELSEKQKELLHMIDRGRNVFDVSGLWTAYFYSYDTEGFYHQLALAQLGIERHSKIIPSDATWRAIKRWEYFEQDEAEPNEDEIDEVKKDTSADEKLELKFEEKKKHALESYYRRRFWNAMLRYNRLRIYLTQYNDKNKEELRPRAAKWDIDAVSSLTHYLSKRAVIGEYVVISLAKDDIDAAAENVNFICVGQPAQPFGNQIYEHIIEKCKKTMEDNINQIHVHSEGTVDIKDPQCICHNIQVKGFKSPDNSEGLYMFLPRAKCAKCRHLQENNRADTNITEKTSKRDHIPQDPLPECPIRGCSMHKEIAQLVLWREDGEKKNQFRVSIIGNSGPATFGLSSMFVDEEQKLCDFLVEDNRWSDDKNGGYLLYELQKHVRERVYKLLKKNIAKKIGVILKLEQKEGEEKQRLETYRDLVIYAIYSYLSTVLYRYFLPFLTEKDIDRIYNDVYMFINSMKAEKQSPFSLNYKTEAIEHMPAVNMEEVKEIIKMLPGTIKQFLKEFKGLEAFYEVDVELDNDKLEKISNEQDENWDVRKTTAVRPLTDEEINLFIVGEPEVNGGSL